VRLNLSHSTYTVTSTQDILLDQIYGYKFRPVFASQAARKTLFFWQALGHYQVLDSLPDRTFEIHLRTVNLNKKIILSNPDQDWICSTWDKAWSGSSDKEESLS